VAVVVAEAALAVVVASMAVEAEAVASVEAEL
jgi:hypothetical protein